MNLTIHSDSTFAPAVSHFASLPADQRGVELAGYMDFLEDTALEGDPVDVPVDHALIDGLYFRTMHAPAGTLVAGRTHTKACVVVLSKGSLSVVTDKGCMRFTAPQTFVSPAGSRRIGYIHEDVVWTTVMATQATTIEDIEADVFEDLS